MFEVIELGDMKTVTTTAATNHVYVVDVSGSMYSSLPKMRTHLKNIVSLVAKEDDTFSVIYFSGRGQCGIVCEGVPVKDLGCVTAVQEAIDRWLTPIGLTGFAEPIELAIKLVASLDQSKFNNFVMLTDGYDNQSKKEDIINSCLKLPTYFESSSFIEYGWYCDRDLLAKMAQASSGFHVFAGSYTEYETVFDSVIVDAVKESRVDVSVNKKAKHAIYIHNGKVAITEPDSQGIVRIPETVSRVHSIVPNDVLQKHLSTEHLYVIMYYAAKTNNSKLVWRCLEALGDVYLIDEYTNAFTRQEVQAFLEATHKAAIDPSARLLNGKDLEYIPDENATTVLDIMHSLNDGETKLVIDSPYFSYNRIGRSKEKNDDLPKFVAKPGQTAKITDLVFNSSRPNVSIQTLLEGNIEVPENEFDIKYVPNKQFRNYAVVRDGLLNTTTLPVIVTQHTYHELVQLTDDITVIDNKMDQNMIYAVINLSKTPVIDRAMTKDIDFDVYRNIVKESFVVKGITKGLKYCLSAKDSKTESMKDTYGEKAAEWLSSIGIRDYGFSPKVSTKESTDFYYSTELECKVKGLSGLASKAAVEKKMKSGKDMTVSEYLVWEGMNLGQGLGDEQLKTLIAGYVQHSRKLDYELSQIVYAVIIGKTWFEDIELDDEEPLINGSINFYDTYDQKITAQIVRKEIKI